MESLRCFLACLLIPGEFLASPVDWGIYTLSAVSRRFQVSQMVCSDQAMWKIGMHDLQKVILANHPTIFLQKQNSGDLSSVRHGFEKMKPFTTSLKLFFFPQFSNLFFQNTYDHFAEFHFNLMHVLLWRMIKVKIASKRPNHYLSLSTECLKCSRKDWVLNVLNNLAKRRKGYKLPLL